MAIAGGKAACTSARAPAGAVRMVALHCGTTRAQADDDVHIMKRRSSSTNTFSRTTSSTLTKVRARVRA